MTASWTPVGIDLGVLPVRRRRQYTPLEIYDAVDRYRREFLAGKRSTNRQYREFCRGKIATPGLNTVLRMGPLDDLLREVEIAGWEYRVTSRRDPRAKTREELETRRAHRLRVRANKPRRRRVVRYIADHGSASAREISEALGCSLYLIRHDLTLLRAAGLVEWANPISSRKQRWVLASALT